MSVLSDRHGGNIFGFQLEEQKRIWDFSININPLGLSPLGKDALCREWEAAVLRYPDTECRGLKQELSFRYEVPESRISVGNGATELMYLLTEVLNPSKVYIPAPSFSEYEFAAKQAGVPIVTFALSGEGDFSFDPKELATALIPRSLVFLGHPNNPDGALLSRESLFLLLDAAERTASHIVIDESFVDFVGDAVSFRKEAGCRRALIVLASLTKFYSVPGLRIGCCFAEEDIAARLNDRMIPWHVNGPVQLYMCAALRDMAYQEASRTFCGNERERMAKALQCFPSLKVFSGKANFILCQFRQPKMTGQWLQEKLRPFHILIRQCGNYRGLDERYFRLAVRERALNDKMLHAMREVLD